MARSKTYSKKVILFALGILIFSFYGAIELCSALFLKLRPTLNTRISIGGGISYSPFSRNSLPGYPSDLSTDGYGFIHNGEDNRVINEGDIFIFGGSTVEGRGSSSNSTTISAFLENCLNEDQKESRVNVINVGFSGDYSSQQYSRLISTVLIHYRPSIVIYLDGRNDAHLALPKSYFPEFANYALYPISNPMRQETSNNLIFPTTGQLAKRVVVKLNKLISNTSPSKILPMPDYSQMNLSQRAEKAASNWKEVSLKTKGVTKRKGIHFFHFLQPTLALGKEAEGSKHFSRFFARMGLSKSSEYLDIIRQFYKIAKRTANQYGHIYDITSVVPEDSSSYVDSVHYNDESNMLISTKICNVVSSHRSKYAEKQ